jgi:hypothetical protein
MGFPENNTHIWYPTNMLYSCICVKWYIYISHTYIYIYTHTYTRMYSCICVKWYIYIYIYITHIYIYTHTYTRISYIHICTQIHFIYTHTDIYMCVYKHTCMQIHLCILLALFPENLNIRRFVQIANLNADQASSVITATAIKCAERQPYWRLFLL